MFTFLRVVLCLLLIALQRIFAWVSPGMRPPKVVALTNPAASPSG